MTGSQALADEAYRLTLQVVGDSPRNVGMVLGPMVTDGWYCPSAKAIPAIRSLRNRPSSHTIGVVTELLAAEILEGGSITLGVETFKLTCMRLKEFLVTTPGAALPTFGIRCDDLAVIGMAQTDKRLIIVECKGTNSVRGFSRDSEAKMIYQLSWTFESLKRGGDCFGRFRLGGGITAQMNHRDHTVKVMVGDPSSILTATQPDAWMYPNAGPLSSSQNRRSG